MDVVFTLNDYFTVHLPQIEEEMRRAVNRVSDSPALPITTSHPPLFDTMLNYHLGFAEANGIPVSVYGGKRIRPMLTLLACEACGGSADVALPAAAAIELMHNFSLVHDDIEDRDRIRRGRPTLWTLWGNAQAINTGDAMFALAHSCIEALVERGADPVRAVHALRVFDDAAVALTVGQHMDLSFEARSDVSVDEYMAMIQGKTGALTQAACAIGALLGGASDERIRALAAFGAWLGIAFQLQDDILGIWGDPAVTGKLHSDLSHRKRTLPVLYAAAQDAHVRELYFGGSSNAGSASVDNALPDTVLAEVLHLIVASGAREYTEQVALDTCTRAMKSLDSAQVDNPSGALLRELAWGLLGRES